MSTLKPDLAGVPATLLLPLWGRAQSTRSANPVLVDQKAVELVESLDFDFSTIENMLSDYGNLYWARRALLMDRVVQAFMARHPRGVVVNLGAGLDTTFHRVDNGEVRWFDLDLPETAAVRRRLLPEGERNRLIEGSMLDPVWVEQLPPDRDEVLLLSGGVMIYFEELQVRALFEGLSRRLPGADFVFDVLNGFGVWSTNKYLDRVGMSDARLRWALSSPQELERWGGVAGLVETWPIFRGIAPDPDWPVRLRVMMWLNDTAGFGGVVHLRLGKPK